MATKEETAGILKHAADMLRSVGAERDELRAENDQLKQERRIEKLAAAARERGAFTDMKPEELHAHLVQQAEQGKLASIEQGLEMYGPNMQLGRVNNDGARVNHDGPSAFGSAAEERFASQILGN